MTIAALATAVLTVFVAACSKTTNVTNIYETPADGGDAASSATDAGDATMGADGSVDAVADATEAGLDATSDGGPPCTEVFPPPKPAADDPSDAGNQTVVVALHTIDLGFDDDAGTPPIYGYNLDRVYTDCQGGAESCVAASAGATHPDELGGRDNYGGLLLSKLASFDPGQFSSTSVSERMQAGTYSLLLQIAGYNGTANDTQVTATLYTSDGIQAVGDASPMPTKWDGTDVWTLDVGSVLLADASPPVGAFSDVAAYVSSGTLVAHVNFPISLGTSAASGITVGLTGGVVTGTVVPVGNGMYRLTGGLIAGRWNVTEMLGTLQNLSIAGSPLCQGSALYANIKTQVCQYADIMTNPTDDQTGKTCDALSLAFAFTADPANMGAVVSRPSQASPCEAGTPDNCSMP
jgi:hypothetical protein